MTFQSCIGGGKTSECMFTYSDGSIEYKTYTVVDLADHLKLCSNKTLRNETGNTLTILITLVHIKWVIFTQ